MVDGMALLAILSLFAVKNAGIESTQIAASCCLRPLVLNIAQTALSRSSTSQPVRLERIEFNGTCDDRNVPHPGADSI